MLTNDAQVNLTNSAAKKIYNLIKSEGNMALKLRVYIFGGGCSGFQYGFAFDEKLNADDIITTTTPVFDDADKPDKPMPVNTVIDAMSMEYLQGSEVDYKEELRGSHFVVRNPNANTTCGCGSSFSVD